MVPKEELDGMFEYWARQSLEATKSGEKPEVFGLISTQGYEVGTGLGRFERFSTEEEFWETVRAKWDLMRHPTSSVSVGLNCQVCARTEQNLPLVEALLFLTKYILEEVACPHIIEFSEPQPAIASYELDYLTVMKDHYPSQEKSVVVKVSYEALGIDAKKLTWDMSVRLRVSYIQCLDLLCRISHQVEGARLWVPSREEVRGAIGYNPGEPWQGEVELQVMRSLEPSQEWMKGKEKPVPVLPGDTRKRSKPYRDWRFYLPLSVMDEL